MIRKKIVFLGLALSLFNLVSVFSADTLDIAIKKASDYVLDVAIANTSVAIVRINSGSEGLSFYVLNELQNYLINDPRSQVKGLTFVDRSVFMYTHIEDELTFRYSAVNDVKMASMSKRSGAQFIINGEITEKRDSFNMNIKITDVKTAKLLGSNSFEIIADEDMFSYITNSTIEFRRMVAAKKKAAQEKEEEEARKAAPAKKRTK